MTQIAIFASGSGSNAEAIVRYFHKHPNIRVGGIYTNNPQAYVLQRAARLGVPAHIFGRQEFFVPGFGRLLQQAGHDLLVLAGFLWLVPAAVVQLYPGRILNIHPALLPRFGGKGMYGERVHRAVLEAGEKESGITIHYVNENYDEGDIIFQARCPVLPDDTPDTLAQRIHRLEHEHYPRIIEQVARKLPA